MRAVAATADQSPEPCPACPACTLLSSHPGPPLLRYVVHPGLFAGGLGCRRHAVMVFPLHCLPAASPTALPCALALPNPLPSCPFCVWQRQICCLLRLPRSERIRNALGMTRSPRAPPRSLWVQIVCSRPSHPQVQGHPGLLVKLASEIVSDMLYPACERLSMPGCLMPDGPSCIFSVS